MLTTGKSVSLSPTESLCLRIGVQKKKNENYAPNSFVDKLESVKRPRCIVSCPNRMQIGYTANPIDIFTMQSNHSVCNDCVLMPLLRHIAHLPLI